MTEAVEYPRGVVGRGVNKQGNPGTFLGTKTVDGVTYARYRAEKGTWVSASLEEQNYGLLFGKKAAYGAYTGIVRSPDGAPLANPDRIEPGQEYLFPIPPDEGQARRISVDGPSAKPQIAQKPTLSHGPGKGKNWEASNLELTRLNIAAIIPVVGFFRKPYAQRKAWYLSKLGAYQDQLHESAKKHRVPEQLIAAVILNELADISTLDIIQEGAVGGEGSVGIAQIQVDTAIKNDLVPKDDAYRFAKSLGFERPFVAGALKVPQIAIDAAAKEVRIQLDVMTVRKDRPWQTKFGFDPGGDTSSDPQVVYSYIHKVPGNMNVEMVMAKLVSAAYNSPDITIANEPEKYRAALHGQNAAFIAKDLYEMNLFRPGW